MGGRVISLADYRQLRAAGNRQAARDRLSPAHLKKSHPLPPKTRQRLEGSYVDSIYRAETSLTSPQKVSPKWWDSGLIVPAVALLGCLAVVALGL